MLSLQVDKLGQFTASVVDSLRERLFHLQTQVDTAASEEDKNSLLTVRSRRYGKLHQFADSNRSVMFCV